ncbi:MAG: 4Fe-4S dicluster domain-containing protein [Alphaproteobacteria bacterium]|nr:4Fe-4S dicluster domain-containing protein [Alphaproteobacteria bacterium]
MNPPDERAPWTPDPAQRALWPGVSGNTINGLGETEPRRPSPLYWHDPAKLAHGPLQNWMAARSAGIAEMRAEGEAMRALRKRPLAPLAPVPVERNPEAWAGAIRAFALAHEADVVGVARMDPAWVFEGYEVNRRTIIMIGVAMAHDRLALAPAEPAGIEVLRQYHRGNRAARALADWLRGQGHDAEPHGGPMAGAISLLPAAIAAGLGELGKHGSLINRTLGSRFRLACVLTDLSVALGGPDDFGSDGFCASCRVCERACPPGAIGPEKQMVRGERKWYVDFDACVPYFNEHHGCAICVAVCPWSRPGVADRLVQKLARRAERTAGAGADAHVEGTA